MKNLTMLAFVALLTTGCSATGQVRADDNYFSQAELDSMLAPVALYPDSVLSHVLIAATYPLEVIQAARFSRERPGLRGEEAVAAVEHIDWDPSVKALVAFPELLRRMDEDLQWTQDLGDAFLVQEGDVIASIQYLRSEAYSQGHLRSDDHVRVVREKEYIYIEPARTRVVYVPYYDPRVIYSSWRWHNHPPRYWHRPSGFSLSVNFHWGRAYHVRPSFYFSSFHWPTRKLVVVNHHHHYYRDHGFRSARDVARFKQARHWKHDPTHRRGVSYRGRVEKTRFVDNSRPASARVESRSVRAAVRSDRREWAAERRSGLDLQSRSAGRSSAVARSERSAEARGVARAESRSATRAASRQGAASGRENRSVRSRESSPAAPSPERRAVSREQSSSRSATRSRSDSVSRVRESLGRSESSRSSSRDAAIDRSRGSKRSSALPASRSSSRSDSNRQSRPGSQRAASAPSRNATLRSSPSRDRSSAPARSSRSSSPSRSAVISRESAPSRQSAPSRSHSSVRQSAPARSAPRSRASVPSRSAKSASVRSSRGASPRSSRQSAPSRSRGGDSRRSGRGGEDRR